MQDDSVWQDPDGVQMGLQPGVGGIGKGDQ